MPPSSVNSSYWCTLKAKRTSCESGCEGGIEKLQAEILAMDKIGQVFHLEIRAEMQETRPGLWFGEKNKPGRSFVVKSPAVEFGKTLNKHS